MTFFGRKRELTQLKNLKATGLNCYKYVFFSGSGFTAKETEDVKFIKLGQLF